VRCVSFFSAAGEASASTAARRRVTMEGDAIGPSEAPTFTLFPGARPTLCLL
jgi:hypothetical protein